MINWKASSIIIKCLILISNSLSTLLLLLLPYLIYPQPLGQSIQVEESAASLIPEGDYCFPIRPGLQNYLSGTMGEIRGTHLHAGIDIKTGAVTGYKVYSLADGYVSRIKISSYGYGRAVYITHPNQTISVYAHLKSFKRALEDFTIAMQYEKQSFEVDFTLEPGRFRVKKGEVIARSGNTGSSRAPHLHFELRDIKNRPLNPLEIGFKEVKDQIPPVLLRVALVTMDIDSRVNGMFGRFEFDAIPIGNHQYRINNSVHIEGSIGVEIKAHDKLDGAKWNRNGFPEVKMSLNDQLIFHQDIRRMNFSAKSNIKVYMNYQRYVQANSRFQKLFIDHGNWLDIYEKIENRGLIVSRENQADTISIELTDTYQNSSFCFIKIDTVLQDRILESIAVYSPEISRGVLKFAVPRSDSVEAVSLSVRNVSYYITPSYFSDKKAIYLWSMSNGMPTEIRYRDSTVVSNLVDQIIPSSSFVVKNKDFKLEGRKNTVFDTVFVKYQKGTHEEHGEVFDFQNLLSPFRLSAKVTLKPLTDYGSDRRYQVYSLFGDKLVYLGGDWTEGNEITVRTKELGPMVIQCDTVPPKIDLVRSNYYGIELVVKDERSGIKEFRGTLDGNFLLLEYDIQHHLLQSRKPNPSDPLKGEFALKVVDNAGNESVFTQVIK